jgi:Putative auto-transporter adhesin, head GIN domain
MNRTLGLVAVSGLSIGVVCLSLAWAIGGRDLRSMIAEDRFGWRSCDDDTVAVAGNERRLPWTGGDTIEITTPVPLHLVAGDGGELVMRGTPDTIAHLRLRGGRLFSCGRLGAGPVDIELPSRALRHVRISGAGTITLEKLDQRELGLAISGSGDIQAQGTVERVSAEISGTGNVRLADVALKRLKTKISGSGRVEAGPTDEADIHLSGAGTVKLLTRPAALHTKVSGAGRIIQPSVESADKK